MNDKFHDLPERPRSGTPPIVHPCMHVYQGDTTHISTLAGYTPRIKLTIKNMLIYVSKHRDMSVDINVRCDIDTDMKIDVDVSTDIDIDNKGIKLYIGTNIHTAIDVAKDVSKDVDIGTSKDTCAYVARYG